MNKRNQALIELVACAIIGSVLSIWFLLWLADSYLPSVGIN